MDHPYADFIQRVQKPARYLGGEKNAVVKPWDSVGVRLCLAFPDLYDIGMSHLGTKILYKLLNDDPGILAERAFAPWPDMEAELRARSLPVLSLESARPLRDFDVIGCSLQFEMTYTNVLTLLDLSGVPLLAAERSDADPLVIGGGPCATHPEAVAPFFDAFLIGDAEEGLPIALHTIGELRAEGRPREEILRALAALGGWYCPSLYELEIDPRTGIQVVAGPRFPEVPARVSRLLVEDLSKFPFPDDSPVAAAQAIFDRMSVEIARGCTEGCRFCQAGMIYRPVRERDPEEIVETLVSAIRKGGYDEASLTSLSTADYSCISPLIKKVARRLAVEDVSLSVSSLRAYGLGEDVLDELRSVKAGGLTFAPEAGSQRMRDVVNKNVSEEDVETTAHRIFERGWNRAKLYFMIGLPTEEDEDLLGIVDMGRRFRDIGRRYLGGKGPEVTCSVSCHVPKPHTPFQWCAFDSLEELGRKQALLHRAARSARVTLKTHDRRSGQIEAIIGRGDRRVAGAIMAAYRRGCRFDSWDQHFNYEEWCAALAEAGIDPAPYLTTLPLDGRLPWDHIDVGLADGFLRREWKRAVRNRLSPPCAKPVGEVIHHTNVQEAEADQRLLVCYHCGVACDLTQMREERIDYLTRLGSLEPGSLDAGAPSRELFEARGAGESRKRRPRQSPNRGLNAARYGEDATRTRYRVRYAKLGRAAFTGHLDIVRELQRLCRQADLRVWMTEGYKPRPALVFGPPLRLGYESLGELVDISLAEDVPTREMVARLGAGAGEGLAFLSARRLGEQEKSLPKVLRWEDYLVVPGEGALARAGVAGFAGLAARAAAASAGALPTISFERKGDPKIASWDECIALCDATSSDDAPPALEWAPGLPALWIRLSLTVAPRPRPAEVAAAVLGLEDLGAGSRIARTAQWALDEEGELSDPLEPVPDPPAARPEAPPAAPLEAAL